MPKTKFTVEDIIRCQYAGDHEDEYCCTCNGVTMEIDGKEFSCKECQSYTPIEEPHAPEGVDVIGPSETSHLEQTDTEYVPQGLVTSIKAESGLSIETKHGWYRFSYTEERLIPESADIEKEKEALWNTVNAEVDRQAEEVKNMCK